jgi:hypothetical protein
MKTLRLAAGWRVAVWSPTLLVTTGLLLAGAPLAPAQQVTIEIGSGTGTQGGSAAITIGISGTDDLNVSEAQVDVLFDSASLSLANVDPTTHAVADCVPDGRFAPGGADCPGSVPCFLYPAVIATIPPPPAGQTRLRMGVTSLPPIRTFGDGPLFTCTFQIAETVPVPSDLTLTGDRPIVTDKDLNPIAVSPITPGMVFVREAPPTNTPENTPTATNTPLPTATNTPLPTATNTPLPTATNTPLPTATNTPLPTATNTALPTATKTALPTATNTARPTATQTSPPAGGGADDDSCAISRTRSGASLLWLLIPPAVMVWRRRR